MIAKRTELNRIILYRSLLEDELVNLVCQMLDSEGAANKVKFEEYFYMISHRCLPTAVIMAPREMSGQPTFSIFCCRTKPYSLGCECSVDDIDPQLHKMARHDLENLRSLLLNWMNVCKSAFIRLDCNYPSFPD
jgi:hypothetical protein